MRNAGHESGDFHESETRGSGEFVEAILGSQRKVPTEMETIPTAYYDSVPVPKKEDYKMLRNIVWSQESNNTEDSYMVIRGTKSLDILATETYDVTVYLKDFKE